MERSDLHKFKIQNSKFKINITALYFALVLCTPFTCTPPLLNAAKQPPCLNHARPSDALLITAPDGRIVYKQNETTKYIPASTLKLLTALSAIHHLGQDFRFRTEFYTDPEQNLKIKGYGDPLLTSEVWQQIACVVAKKIPEINNLILDNSYFSKDLIIPGIGHSTNPYDAPSGALCANFNTVFFDHDSQGRIISAEPQTPMTPFAREKIRLLGLEKGRYTFSHDQQDASRYAGELFLYFSKKSGIKTRGDILQGVAAPDDKLIYTHLSGFALDQVIKNMMAFSNNFVANQICIAVGTRVYGPPGTLEKGIKVISDYAETTLGLKDITLVEGSGISRENRVSPLDMARILDQFKPYRNLLQRKENILYKTGTLEGIRTRAGYIEASPNEPYSFVVFLNRESPDIDNLMKCVERIVIEHHISDQ